MKSMFKLMLFASIVTCFSFLSSCKANVEQRKMDVITDFYNTFFTSYTDENLAIENHCTVELRESLNDEYKEWLSGFDGIDLPEDGYATELFKTDYQDGPSDISKLVGVIHIGGDWFKADVLDMGHECTRYLKVIETQLGAYQIDEVYDYEPNIDTEVYATDLNSKINAFIDKLTSIFSQTGHIQETSYAKTYSSPNVSINNELQNVLNRIAGTYELTENLGIYGIKTVYKVTINSNGSGKIVFDNGEMENFYSARLSGSNKITFNGDYGGTTFTYDRYGIEDESVKKYLTEIGTPKYVMTKIR